MLNNVDKQFHDLYQNLIDNGHLKGDRTGHGTLMLPAQMMRFDCTEGKLPILSTRFVPTKAFRIEMLKLFVAGTSSIKGLRDEKVGVWDSWFIPGTDKYDEPQTYDHQLQDRINLAVKQGLLNDILDFIQTTQAEDKCVGNYGFTYVDSNGQRVHKGNLPMRHLSKLNEKLTEWNIPTKYTPKFQPTPFQDQLKLAVEDGRSAEILAFIDQMDVYDRACYKEIKLSGRDGKVVTVGLTKTQYLEVEDFVAEMGYETKIPNGGEKISLQRRLARVSKNDTAKWDEINKASIPDPMVDWDGETYQVTVFKDGKFQDVTWDYGQYINVNKVLNELKVPAYELLDADIGAGSYGPQWRKWQDTQVIDGGDKALVEAYVEQGYELMGTLQEGIGWDNGKVVMHREIDQLQNAIDMLKTNPDDRRMIVTSWNPGRTWQAALPPCHLYFQFVSWIKSTKELEAVIHKAGLYQEYVQWSIYEDVPGPDDVEWFHEFALKFCTEKGLITRNLTLFVLLRSSDTPLGLCFNTAQYAYLLHMVGHVVNMDPNELVSVGVDSHLYGNQIPKIQELLTRESHPDSDPRVVFKRKVDNIDDFKFEDIEIVGYTSQAKLDIPVAV